MAFSYKTPGVYLEEIVKLPPSVASVETAIPCFFGVTKTATEFKDNDLAGTAKKIYSQADYELYFGGADVVKAQAVVKLNMPAEASLSDAYTNNMFYAVKHYFDNGGGPCYVHSVGNFDRADVDADSYKNELAKLNLVDEVTLIVLPDLAALNDADKIYDVYNSAMLKVSALQDKFVVIDVNYQKTGGKISAQKAKADFRDRISNNVDAIKYGAAYFPNLETTYSYDFSSADITMSFPDDVMAASKPASLLNKINYKTAKKIFTISSAVSFFNADYFKNINTETYTNTINEINSRRNTVLPLLSDTGQQSLLDNTRKLTDLLKSQAKDAADAGETKFDLVESDAEITTFVKQLQDETAATFAGLDDAIKTELTGKGVDSSSYATLHTTFLSEINPFFNSLFEARLKEAFLNIPVVLPPSPAIAGVYAAVDRNRGVWKAPANVSLNAVKKPEVQLSDLDQQDFNVDAENGKSINCIRQFTGRGNLVWGARTLAGNNNEWKYVNVRRFFNMVEESCRNAARQFVFEPNDANTWVRVRGMIDNYLTNLWRAGALQGAKPEHAFYTAVGLNQTMTADDILNGLLIVEIGLAVVRPAEFIILRFSHKLAVS